MQRTIADINPRMAAFLLSHGREATIESARRFTRQFTNADFMEFISRAKAGAPLAAVNDGRVVDHDAFTAHCWAVAREDTLRRFPA